MDANELVETWKREEEQPFSGWDFSYLDGRMIEEQAPWSYSSRAAELMRRSSAVIDLGTGGGELYETWWNYHNPSIRQSIDDLQHQPRLFSMFFDDSLEPSRVVWAPNGLQTGSPASRGVPAR